MIVSTSHPSFMLESHRVCRCPCLLSMVRHPLRLHPQKSQLLHWPARAIHTLEVRLLFPLLIPIRISISFQILTRQTVFYTPTTLTLNEGDTIKGTLKCAPNARNNRDLDITIDYSTPTTSETIAYKMCVLSLLHIFVPSVRLAGRLGTSLTNCQVLIILHQLIVFYALHACIIKYCRYR